jgi:hypothetical protein
MQALHAQMYKWNAKNETIDQWVCNKSITTGTTCEIGTTYPSEHMSSSPVFARSVVCTYCLHIIVCPFVLCLLAS